MDIPDLKEIITAFAALVGAGLGIYNFFHGRAGEKVRLQVIPAASHVGASSYVKDRNRFNIDSLMGAPDMLAIEIINKSKFPVTINAVGLAPRWKRGRFVLLTPTLPDQGEWPRKLGPRESVTVLSEITDLLGLDGIDSVRRAYASTACGTTRYGNSGALREFVRLVKDATRGK